MNTTVLPASCDSVNVCFEGADCVDGSCLCPDSKLMLGQNPTKCLGRSQLNATCEFDEQCDRDDEAECDPTTKLCLCLEGYKLANYDKLTCIEGVAPVGTSKVDPAMIGVLAGLALMFVIICVVLRLFSKARFRENRSIFNTPNPRLMNASLFKDSKLSPARSGDRRGSRISVRAPSRAASITSMSKDFGGGKSPNGSLAKGGTGVTGRRGSAISTASVAGGGSLAGGGGGGRTGAHSSQSPSPASVTKKPHHEHAVAIESVD